MSIDRAVAKPGRGEEDAACHIPDSVDTCCMLPFEVFAVCSLPKDADSTHSPLSKNTK